MEKNERIKLIRLKQDMNIDELEFSVRTYNCLKRAGINTVGEILAFIKEDGNGLRKIRNLGGKSENEILECIQPYRDKYGRY